MKTEEKQVEDDQCGSQGLWIWDGIRSNAHTTRQAPLVNLKPRETLPSLV